jgi:hypothetical protein
MAKTYRAGEAIEDYCRQCKTDRIHTVIAADHVGVPIRVQCGFCRSEHNYRGGPRIGGASPVPARPTPVAPPRLPAPALAPMSGPISAPIPSPAPMSHIPNDLESLLRQIIREESGLTPVAPAEKWRGGTMVLRPGKPGLQEKTWPIDTFFHKVVMLRNRLRTLEQQVNAADMPDDAKVRLQAYITACYGSLTSFNVLFADEADGFKGAGSAGD